jgi:pSer/pThr/pTyr-binding forkhead associated (FHA) protein
MKESPAPLRGIIHFLSPGAPCPLFKLPTSGSVIFGREKGDLRLDDALVSATHCQIQTVEQAYILFDMNSRNGTYVNEEKIRKKTLSPEDQIRIGQTLFVFRLESEPTARGINSLFQATETSRGRGDKTTVLRLLQAQQLAVSWQLTLQVSQGNQSPETILIPQQQVVLGRGSGFTQFAEDVNLSRKHLLIQVNERGEVFIDDQGSRNGSYLNGVRIQGLHRVMPQDRVEIGSLLLFVAAIAKI